MTDATKLQTLDKFIGINNVDDATRIAPLIVNHEYVHSLQTAVNVDIDNTFRISSRPGYAEITEVAGTAGVDNHSLWSDGLTCLFVDGATLYELTTSYRRVYLRSDLVVGARMSYAPFNDRIYYTNEHQIGYVKNGEDNHLPDPDTEFKESLPAGQFIEYYRGCLYVARDKILYVSDPLCDYYDIRHGYKQFASRITLLRAVDDGLYIGDDRIWWVQGDSPEEFQRREVYSHRAIPYTDVRTNGQDVGDGIKGSVAIWTGENGICLGDNSGTVINLTESRYTFTSTNQGTGFIRNINNILHYINSLY